MKDSNFWVLLANGSHAKIIKNPVAGNRQTVSSFHPESSPGAEHSDRAGRGASSVGKRRYSLVQHSDPIREKERLFAEDLSSHLLKCMDKGQFDTLALAASPRTLGDLRSAFPDRLHDCVSFEIAKDLTNTPENEVGDALLSLLNKS